MGNKENYISYNSDRTIWRAVVLNPYPITFWQYSQDNVKKFEMDQDNSSDKKSCEFHQSENGYDCYTETTNNGNFPHDRMMVEMSGNANTRRMCMIILLEETTCSSPQQSCSLCSSMLAPSHLASKTYTVGDTEDQIEVGEFTLTPAGCPVTYSTTVSPVTSFMT